jgi:hypothetical protein
MRCLEDALQQIGGVCRRPAVLAYSMALSSSDRQDHGRPGTETARRRNRAPLVTSRTQDIRTTTVILQVRRAFCPVRPALARHTNPPQVDALGIRV